MTGTISIEVPTVGNPNSSEDPKVRSSLITLRDEVNALLDSGNKVPDTSLTSPNNSAYRTIFYTNGGFGQLLGAGTYTLCPTNTPLKNETEFEGVTFIPYFYFDNADWEVAGKTLKMRLRAQVTTNATKPALKFTAGVYPISSVAGAANKSKYTLGSVVSGSTIEFNEPAASTITPKETADFTIPADGLYVVGCVTSAETTANSRTTIAGQVQVRNV